MSPQLIPNPTLVTEFALPGLPFEIEAVATVPRR